MIVVIAIMTSIHILSRIVYLGMLLLQGPPYNVIPAVRATSASAARSENMVFSTCAMKAKKIKKICQYSLNAIAKAQPQFCFKTIYVGLAPFCSQKNCGASVSS